MSELIYRLFIKVIAAQLCMLALGLTVVGYISVQAGKQNAEIYLRANLNDLLLGDYRQAAINLRASLWHEFDGVRVETPTMGKVLDLGSRSDRSMFSKTFTFPVSLDQNARDPMTISFVYNYSGVFKRTLLIGLLIIALNSILFFVLRNKIEDAVERKVESARLRDLGNLARSVAHDVRSPLSVIQIGAQKITLINSELGTALALAVKRIDDIASDLLKNYSMSPELPRVSMSMKECLFQAQNVSRELKAHFQNIEFNLVSDCVLDAQIHLSAMHWERILANLLNNAAEARASVVNIELKNEARGFLGVEIRDNGLGMNRKVLQNIRARRFRSWNKLGGHGIGLRSCIETIESVGGSWIINSELGRGAQIKFNIPKHND